MIVTGLLMSLGAGMLWAAVACVVASAGRRGCGMDVVQPLMSVFILAFGAVMCVTGAGASAGLQSTWWQDGAALLAWAAASVALAGLGNFLMLIFAQRGMRVGNPGVVWAFTQSSLIWPFAAGMLFFSEPPTAGRVAGITAILVSLCIFSRIRGRGQETAGSSGGFAWLVFSLLAFSLSGFAQTAASIPSFLGVSVLRPLDRSVLLNGGIAVSACVFWGCRRCLPRISGAAALHAFLFAVFNLVSQLLLYSGMDLLRGASCAGIAYPVAQGTSIGLFFAWENRRGHVPRAGVAGLLLLLAGIALCGL